VTCPYDIIQGAIHFQNEAPSPGAGRRGAKLSALSRIDRRPFNARSPAGSAAWYSAAAI